MINLDQKQLDIITEIINVGIGRSASVLNTMLNSHIKLKIPKVMIIDAVDLVNKLNTTDKNDGPMSAISMAFSGNLAGTSQIMFPEKSASHLVAAFTGEEEPDDLEGIDISVLNEIGNVVLNAVMGSIGNMLGLPLKYNLPSYLSGGLPKLFQDHEKNVVILYAQADFLVETMEIRGDIAVIFTVEAFDILIESINQYAINSGLVT